MSVEFKEYDDGKLLEICISGKLTKEDYQQFVPEAERLIKQYGKLRMLFRMRDFHGWSASAAWEDLKFDLKHFRDIERLAIMGENKWQKGMAFFCKPFTTAKIRYFTPDQMDDALAWLKEQPAGT